MHWDATIPIRDKAFRFEIDGAYHARPTPRHVDLKKNAIVVTYNVCLLRMHESDNSNWAGMAQAYVRDAAHGVYYTDSYDAFRNPTDQGRKLAIIDELLGARLIE